MRIFNAMMWRRGTVYYQVFDCPYLDRNLTKLPFLVRKQILRRLVPVGRRAARLRQPLRALLRRPVLNSVVTAPEADRTSRVGTPAWRRSRDCGSHARERIQCALTTDVDSGSSPLFCAKTTRKLAGSAPQENTGHDPPCEDYSAGSPASYTYTTD